VSLFDEILGESTTDIQASIEFIDDLLVAFEEEMAVSGITQAELAKRLGLTSARVSQMFSGNGQNFTAGTIAKIAHAFGKVARVRFEPAMERSTKPKATRDSAELAPGKGRKARKWQCANDNYWNEGEKDLDHSAGRHEISFVGEYSNSGIAAFA
jgi:transcriptional regulator with XRE-family HTH domain